MPRRFGSGQENDRTVSGGMRELQAVAPTPARDRTDTNAPWPLGRWPGAGWEVTGREWGHGPDRGPFEMGGKLIPRQNY